jgi:serine kinase of HPr protein (carbohydrate metabolism regulator)
MCSPSPSRTASCSQDSRTPQVVRTADILDITAIILVRGKKPSEETVKLAEELKIPILSTRYILFETSGRLHAKGIKGCIEKVGGEI